VEPRARSANELRQRFDREVRARKLDILPYRCDVIVRALHGWTANRAMRGILSSHLETDFQAPATIWQGGSIVLQGPPDGLRFVHDREWAVDMSRVPGGPEYERRARELVTACKAAEDFDREPLLKQIDKAMDRERYRPAWGCRGCRQDT
jgi:hypothetical protein